MILTKLLTVALLVTVLALGVATQSFGNEKNSGAGGSTGGGIGGTGYTQTNSDLLVNMSNVAAVPCDKKSSIGSIAIAQGSSIKYKQHELICEGFQIKTQKDEYVVVELQDGVKISISGSAELVFQPNEDVTNLQNPVLKLTNGKIRVTRKEVGANSTAILLKTANSTIEVAGLDAEIILKPTTDTKYSTYVRSYSGVSWLSIENKRVAVPMGYMGFSNENTEHPITEVRKDTGQLGARIPI
jgi:hypothetical protein